MILTASKLMMAAAAVLGLFSLSALPSLAEPATNSIPLPPLSEPYEPGSSTVVNEWQFTPSEQTTVATDSRAHVRHSGQCRNKKYHHSST